MPEKPETPRISAKDFLNAYAQGLGSALLCVFPEAWDFSRNTEAPGATRVRWRPLFPGRYAADLLQQAWVYHDPIPEAGILPTNYGRAQLIRIDREEMDRLQSRHSGDHAVTYKLGSVVMLGASSKHPILGLAHKDAEDYEVAMGIGSTGPLEAGAGVHRLIRGRRNYWGLERGIRGGDVVPFSEVPPHVPFL